MSLVGDHVRTLKFSPRSANAPTERFSARAHCVTRSRERARTDMASPLRSLHGSLASHRPQPVQHDAGESLDYYGGRDAYSGPGMVPQGATRGDALDDFYDGQHANWEDVYAAKQEALADYGGDPRYPGQGRDTQGREVIDVNPRRAARGVLPGINDPNTQSWAAHEKITNSLRAPVARHAQQLHRVSAQPPPSLRRRTDEAPPTPKIGSDGAGRAPPRHGRRQQNTSFPTVAEETPAWGHTEAPLPPPDAYTPRGHAPRPRPGSAAAWSKGPLSQQPDGHPPRQTLAQGYPLLPRGAHSPRVDAGERQPAAL